MKEHVYQDPATAAAAERRMRAWEMKKETAKRITQFGRIDIPYRQLQDYISISREAGCGGSEIARLVGQSLGWEVLDKNLVDRVAEESHLPRSVLELVDETKPNWAYDVLEAWLDPKIVPHEKYVVHLCRVLLAAARQSSVVIVGRGANFVLPRSRGLAVRIIASEQCRVQRVAERLGLNQEQARRRMFDVDRGRRDFVMRFFHHDITDLRLYDLVIQADRFGQAGVAETIVAAYRSWRNPKDS